MVAALRGLKGAPCGYPSTRLVLYSSTVLSPRTARLILAGALVFGLGSVLYAAWEQDWTYDEPYHLRWSERLLDRGITERETSPLWNSKTPISVPYVLAGRVAKALGFAEGRPLMFATRLPGVLAYLLLVAATFALARRHFGKSAAALAAALVAIEPSIVANAPLATVDVPYALATVLALYAGLGWVEKPSARRALGIGLALGLAFVAKFSAFTFLPVLAILPWLVPRPRRALLGRILAHFVLVMVACLFVIAAAYFFEGLGRPWRGFAFHAELFKRAAERFPELRVPLPSGFITGVDRTFSHERNRTWDVVILGRITDAGVPHYFVASWALKTPLALLAFQIVGLLGWRRAPTLRQPAGVLLAWSFAWQLAYFSLLLRAQIGYRFGLMLLPVAFILAAVGFLAMAPRRAALGAGLVVAFGALESAPYLGNSLAFTNGFVRPKRDAFKYLAGSSIDYGQNEEKVDAWLKSKGWPGAHFEPNHIRPGINVMGLNQLAGVVSGRAHRFIRESVEPQGHFRYTYLWFDIDAATYNRFLEEDRRLVSRPQDQAVCGSGEGARLVEPSNWKHFPHQPGVRAWLVCFATQSRVDVGLIDKGGGLNLGRPEWKLRDWDRFRAGEEAWYRLESGVHSLVALAPGEFRGRWRSVGGPLRIWMLPAENPFPKK